MVTPLSRMEGREAAAERGGTQQSPQPQPHVASHVRKELPEDHSVGVPTEERGIRSVPLRGFTRRPGTRP